ncbi:MAG: O-antigen ligase family protein [Chthoniobacterales bacterium]
MWADDIVPLLPLLACLLGGATEKWAEGIVVGLLGLLLVARPPRFSLGVAFNTILVALLACAATAFLPATRFYMPTWRKALMQDFAVDLGSTLSPQPWLSLSCWLSLAAALSWLYLVATQELDTRVVRRQLRLFAGGVALLAALAVGLYLAHTALPFWHNQRGFGWFPNRNQTADLLGITGVIILACGHDDLRQGRNRWVLWLAGFAVLIAAIVLNFSRAGIAIMVAGSALWLATFALRRRSGAQIALGACALLMLLTVMLVFGGQTLERFNIRGEGEGMTTDYRWLIFRDTWQLIRSSPWAGVGLANFDPVFALFRDVSVRQAKALHPESDWLWLWAEAGWPSILLTIAGAGLLLRLVFPFGEGTNQRFRLAALIAALLFGLHGVVDVSAHRVGTAYSGLLLLGLALARPLRLQRSAVIAVFFRCVGVLLIVTGATWIYAAESQAPIPGGIDADNARLQSTLANQQRNFAATIAQAERGLRSAPLDWQLYFLRALGKAGEHRPATEALDDFRRARFLEANSFEVPYQEGLAWLTRQPLLAMTAWREALRRAGPQRVELYSRMITAAAQSDRTVSRMLEDYAATQHDLAVAYLGRLSGPPFSATLQRLLNRNRGLQSLTPEERRTLFDLWAERGDLAQLARFVEAHPDQLALAWRGVAKFRAANNDFAGAYQLAKQFATAPAVPQKATGSSQEELSRALYTSPNNYGVGFTLYDEQMRAGKTDEALATVRHFTDDRNAPAYFHYLEAEAWAAKQNWERAWNAWCAFEAAAKK